MTSCLKDYYLSNQVSLKINTMTEADPQLLSLLEKIANPITEVNVKLHIKGVFAPPQQWKTTDEANPNIFGYSIQFLNKKFTGGKIHPKIGGEPTTQADDKNKKGGKNPVKEEQKPVELDPQTLRKQKEWQALPQEEKFIQTSENPEKMFSLKFTSNQQTELLEGQKIGFLEQTVAQGNAYIILIRKPQISEDQIAKLKKSKPKTLNLGQLYEAKYRGVIDLSQLQIPGRESLTQRVNLELLGDIPADGVKIQTEKTYAFIEISLDKPLSPEVVQVKPQLQQVLPNIENLSKKSISVIQKLKKEITRAIRAVNLEYITFFSKEKDFGDDKKNTGLNSVSTLRLNEINRRKDLFLNEFNNSGKFAILKQRISLVLKAVIVDKFRKQKSASPITKQQIHRTLSELNVFFQQFISQTIDFVLTSENSLIHEDILLNNQVNKASRKQSVAPVVAETKVQQEARIADEYQIINEVKKTEERYLNLVLIHKKSVQSLEKYAQFLIKNQKFDAAFQIYKKINKTSSDFNHRFILCLFMVQRQRIKEVLQTLTSIIDSQKVPASLKYLSTNCLSFMYEQQGDILRSQKYLALSQKYFQIHKNPQLKINPPINPYLQPKPLIPKPQRYTSQLSQSETQQMWSSFVKLLEENCFYDLLAKLLPKIAASDRKKILTIKVNLFNGNYEECLNTLDEMLEKEPKNLDLLQMKADICFKLEKIFECEEVFLLILRQKPSSGQSYRALLRLGYTYLNRKSWQDAKVMFEKVCELRNNCSVGWLGLGVALLQLGNLKSAQEAFSMSSIYNSLAEEPKQYLQRINAIRNNENLSTYKYLESGRQ